MIVRELDERLQKIRVAFRSGRLHRCVAVHDHHSFVRVSTLYAARYSGYYVLSHPAAVVLRVPSSPNAPVGAQLTRTAYRGAGYALATFADRDGEPGRGLLGQRPDMLKEIHGV